MADADENGSNMFEYLPEALPRLVETKYDHAEISRSVVFAKSAGSIIFTNAKLPVCDTAPALILLFPRTWRSARKHVAVLQERQWPM
jgi:hypothetical protein